MRWIYCQNPTDKGMEGAVINLCQGIHLKFS